MDTAGPHGASRAQWLGVAVAALVSLGFVIAAFFPGYMSFDSFEQLRQARSGMYSDWHPPLMSWFWGLLDSLVPGPIGMLAAHNLAFFAGLGIVAALSLGPRVGALAVLAVAALPPVLGLLSTVWKDVGMGAAFTLAVGSIALAGARQSRKALFAALLPLFYGSSVRHDALLAAAPLALWWGFTANDVWLRRRDTRRASVLLGGALLVLLVGAREAIPRLANARPMYPLQQVLLHDLAGLSIARGAELLPEWARQAPETESLDRLRANYSAENAIPVLANLEMTRDPARVRALLSDWSAAVMHDPGTYLEHRAQLFLAQFGISHDCRYYCFQPGVDPLEPRVAFEPSALNRAVMNYLERAKPGVMFRGWFYVSLAVASMAVALLRANAPKRAVLAVVASGLLYALPHFFFAPVPDFRLIWWTVIAALLATVMALGRERLPVASAGWRGLAA